MEITKKHEKNYRSNYGRFEYDAVVALFSRRLMFYRHYLQIKIRAKHTKKQKIFVCMEEHIRKA